MTESEEMKNTSDDSRAVQQIEDISKYLDVLIIRMDSYMKRGRSADIIYFLAWITWVIGGVLIPESDKALMLMWVFSLMYQSFWSTKLHGVFKEFDGALKILEILGMVPPKGHRETRKRSAWARGAELVKEWTEKKQKVQKEAYA